jgi:predicted transposase YdaD
LPRLFLIGQPGIWCNLLGWRTISSINGSPSNEPSTALKTDPLFYELFQAAPQTFFELLQITPPCPYRFESITVKASEKRIDGVLEPADPSQPFYFLEVQAFPDDTIYWRELREVATFFEQRPQLKNREWQAIVLWLNKDDDPGFGTLRLLTRKPKPKLISLDLIQLLKKLPETSLALNVLQPLLAENEGEVRQHVVQWVENIHQATAQDATLEERLIGVLSQLIEEKFKNLNYKELSHMLRLTPLRETASVQEVIKEERIDLLLNQIEVKFGISSEIAEAVAVDLAKLDMNVLKALFRQLLRLETFEQVEVWISDHLPDHPA